MKKLMPKLPVMKARELISRLKKLGFVEKRQKGSHLVLVNENANKQVVVPIPNKDLKTGTMSAILRQAGVGVEEL